MPLDPKIVAGYQAISKVILAMGVQASDKADKFSDWLALGFGAILSLFISNLDKLALYIHISEIKKAAIAYFFSLILVLIQKRLGMMVQSGSSGGRIAQDHMNEIVAAGISFDEFKKLILTSSIYPHKWIISYTYGKMEKAFQDGDATFVARKFAKIAQYQGLVVVCQALLCVYAAWCIATGII